MPFAIDADQPDHEHARAHDVGWVLEARIRLVEDPPADHDQRQPIHQCGEDFGSPPAKGTRAASRQSRRPGSCQRQRDRAAVRDVVRRVGDQRQAVKPDTGDNLHQTEGDGEAKRDPKRALRRRAITRVAVTGTVGVRMGVRH